MKLSVFSPVLASLSLKDSLKYLKSLGVDAMELGVGGYPGTAHADAKLINTSAAASALKGQFDDAGIEISALSVHGNPIHPVKETAQSYHKDFTAACELAGRLGVETVVTFSGCPGDGKGDQPNWVTCAWPNEFAALLKYQWEDCLIPYWQDAAKLAKNLGVKKIALEMHPGFMVYNPETLLTLRAAAGDIIGANLDPSHLIWQGINIVECIKYLGNAVHFFHAKDTRLSGANVAKNGVLDTKSYSDEINRSWIFRTVGYGTDELTWKDILSTLRMTGYDGYISIEHEDSIMSPFEGLEKAVQFLNGIIIRKKNDTGAWWI